ncbi:MAG: hypothetical protein WCO07_01310 [bacterium]
MKKVIKKKETKKIPEIIIERILFDGRTGHISALDVHNESNGYAYFLEVKTRHFHGFNKPQK